MNVVRKQKKKNDITKSSSENGGITIEAIMKIRNGQHNKH